MNISASLEEGAEKKEGEGDRAAAFEDGFSAETSGWMGRHYLRQKPASIVISKRDLWPAFEHDGANSERCP